VSCNIQRWSFTTMCKVWCRKPSLFSSASPGEYWMTEFSDYDFITLQPFRPSSDDYSDLLRRCSSDSFITQRINLLRHTFWYNVHKYTNLANWQTANCVGVGSFLKTSFYGIQKFITMMTNRRPWYLSWGQWIQFRPSYLITLTFINLTVTPSPPKWPPSICFKYSDYNFVRIFHVLPITFPSMWSRAQFMKLCIFFHPVLTSPSLGPCPFVSIFSHVLSLFLT